MHGLHGVYGKVLIADMSEQDPLVQAWILLSAWFAWCLW